MTSVEGYDPAALDAAEHEGWRGDDLAVLSYMPVWRGGNDDATRLVLDLEPTLVILDEAEGLIGKSWLRDLYAEADYASAAPPARGDPVIPLGP